MSEKRLPSPGSIDQPCSLSKTNLRVSGPLVDRFVPLTLLIASLVLSTEFLFVVPAQAERREQERFAASTSTTTVSMSKRISIVARKRSRMSAARVLAIATPTKVLPPTATSTATPLPIAMTTQSLIATPTAQVINLLTNPGFETNFTDWVTHSAILDSANMYSGSKGVKVSGENIWWWGGVYRTVVSLSPNTTYTLRVYARKGAGTLGYIYARNFGGFNTQTTINTSSYTLHSLTFTTGATNTSAEIGAGINSTFSSDYFFVDDFMLQANSNLGIAPINSVDTIIDDMTLSYDDAKPHGVPNWYSWYNPVRYTPWTTYTTNYSPVASLPHTWNALTAWGQVYRATNSSGSSINKATNSRVQLKDIRTFYLSKSDAKWHLLQASTGVAGAAYLEDFANNASVTPNVRTETDGSISCVPGGGYNYHFWPASPKGHITNPFDVGGIFVTVKARLIVDNPALSDDRKLARYVMNLGADIWYDTNVGWDNFKTNRDTGMGRFKLVTPDWQSFNMYSFPNRDYRSTPALVKGNSPPLE